MPNIVYNDKPGVTYRTKTTFEWAFNKITPALQTAYNGATVGTALRTAMDSSVNGTVEQYYQTRRKEDELGACEALLSGANTALAALQLSDADLLLQLQTTQAALVAKTQEAAAAALLAQQNGEQLTATQQAAVDAAAAAQTAYDALLADAAADEAAAAAIATALTAQRDALQTTVDAALAGYAAIAEVNTDDDTSFQ